MATQSDAGLYATVQTYIYQHTGILGSLAFGLVCVAFLIWWKWAEISARPGIAALLRLIGRDPVPEADQDRYSILLAHLNNDNGTENEDLVREGLAEFPAIQVLSLDRTIKPKGASAEQSELVGHEKARRYLEASGATVMIWGSVLKHDGKAVPKLYWTASHGQSLRAERYAPLAAQQFRLPGLFWSDLRDILRMVISAQQGVIAQRKGHYVADQLPTFIQRVRNLVSKQTGSNRWSDETLAEAKMALASALRTYGEQAGQNEPLKEAATLWSEVLAIRGRTPFDWAGTQYNLGNTLISLGDREGGRERLEEAVVAYRQALRVWTRRGAPLDWAAAQTNLGIALFRLGERESGAERLEEAVAACHQALLAWTREHTPLGWATTQNNLGNALSRLGERESGTERLKEAVAAYRQALLEQTRVRVPLDWAMTQNNLGNALSILGERENSTERLEEAVAAYRQALLEHTRANVPLDWAMTQNNLGNALSNLGERENDTERLEEAVAAYRQALLEWTRVRVPLDWAATQYNLGDALRGLGEREGDTKRLEEAVAAYRQALLERTNERVPLDCAMTQNNLGNVLCAIAERESGTEQLEEAVALYGSALEVFASTHHANKVRAGLEYAKRLLAQRRKPAATR
jgi:tetratricopeptide (TPR) repeat protein